MSSKQTSLRRRKSTKKKDSQKVDSRMSKKRVSQKECSIEKSSNSFFKKMKKKIEPVISNNNKREVIELVQTNGMELVQLGDIIDLYIKLVGNPVNKNMVLSIYKTINIILFLYSNVGMSWLEYFYLFPEGRDIFWEMVHDIQGLTIFITSFIFLPKQTQSDWVITSILELFRNIGVIPMAYSTPNKYYWITNNNLAVGIIQSVSSMIYRKTLNYALIDEVKKYKDSITFHINTINKSNMPKCVKLDLISMYNLLENLKSKNSQISLYKFRNSIKNKNFENALKLGKELLKNFLEDKKLVKKHIFNKQNGGRFKLKIKKNKLKL